jgi:ferredoxin/flavodoxin---NADP+ reductase
MLRVAVVGSGPAGVYAAAALTTSGQAVVDVLDRLPCPYGLVRYGVAPDHPKIRSISRTLQRSLEDPAVRFLGNVEVGATVTLDELHRYYDAIVLAHGAAVDRRMGVPGEDLPGSFSATDFVAWYNGHPDAPIDQFTLEARSAVVVGAGNVALDVARVLAQSGDDLRHTDMPDHVLSVLDRSAVRDVHLLARRGPTQTKFTTKELRELGELTEADVVVDPAELELDEASAQALVSQPAMKRNLQVFEEWAAREPEGRRRRVHIRFRLQPSAVLGDERVEGARFERTVLDEQARARGTGELVDVDAQMVVRSVGYRGVALPGAPFDDDSGTIPNDAGRVLRDGAPVPGEYVAGWIKRGPTGVIGTNKHDANETVASLLADADALPRAAERDPDAIVALLADRGVEVVTWQGWEAIERAEAELGQAQGRERAKIAEKAALLRAAAGDVEPVGERASGQ